MAGQKAVNAVYELFESHQQLLTKYHKLNEDNRRLNKRCVDLEKGVISSQSKMISNQRYIKLLESKNNKLYNENQKLGDLVNTREKERDFYFGVIKKKQLDIAQCELMIKRLKEMNQHNEDLRNERYQQYQENKQNALQREKIKELTQINMDIMNRFNDFKKEMEIKLIKNENKITSLEKQNMKLMTNEE